MKYSILLYCPDYKPARGGTSEFAYQVALALCRAGCKVVVLGCNVEARAFDSLQPFKTIRGLPVFRENGLLEKAKFGVELFKFPIRLRHLIKKYQVNYVLFTELLSYKHISGFLRGIALNGVSVHKGIILHGSDVVTIPNMPWATRWLFRRIMDKMDDVFCNSGFTASAARATFGLSDSPVVVGCGVTPETLPPPVKKLKARRDLKLEAQYVLLTIGRLIPRKGIDMVIRSLPEILSYFPNLTYVVAGDGPDIGRLTQLATHVGCANHVRFDGEFNDELLAHYYCAADIFIMPSRYILNECVEGFGIVFIEAGYYGLPVIGGRAGGVPDAIIDGETGILVDPENSQEMAQALFLLLRNPSIRRRMGITGHRRASKELTWEAVAKHISNRVELTLSRVL